MYLVNLTKKVRKFIIFSHHLLRSIIKVVKIKHISKLDRYTCIKTTFKEITYWERHFRLVKAWKRLEKWRQCAMLTWKCLGTSFPWLESDLLPSSSESSTSSSTSESSEGSSFFFFFLAAWGPPLAGAFLRPPLAAAAFCK